MSKLATPTSSSNPVGLFENSSFNENEKTIIKLLLARKLKIGIMERINTTSIKIHETLGDTNNLISAYRSVHVQEYDEFKRTAKYLGINEERFIELDELVYKIETGDWKF